jgi:hypothetical protein
LQEQGKKQGSKRPSLDGWDQALQLAEHALAAFRKAEGQHEGGDLDSADATVGQALLALQDRYKFTHLHKLENERKRSLHGHKVEYFQATPEVFRISRKAATDKRCSWVSFKLEKFEGHPTICKNAVDR